MRRWLTFTLLGLWLLSALAWADHSSRRPACALLEEALAAAYGSLNAQGQYIGPNVPEGATPEETEVIIAAWKDARAQAIAEAKAAWLACEQAD